VKALDAVEKDYILAVLERNKGKLAVTAEQLGIGTATLYRKLKKYGADQSSQEKLRRPSRKTTS
jgi:two-component system, NtrC family, response regulator HydG